MGKRIAKWERRRTKQAEAKARQLAYDALTTDAKLQMIASRPGESKREKARLLGRTTTA